MEIETQEVIVAYYHNGTTEVFFPNMQTLKYIVDNYDLIETMFVAKLHNQAPENAPSI